MINNQQLRQAIEFYSEELQSLLDPRIEEHQKLVQKGLVLFRGQHVTGVKFSHKKMVGTVRDVTPVQVELFFEQLSANRCSCPEEGMCRHQVALFFTILSREQNVFSWVQKWKARWNMEDILSTMQRGSDLLKKPSIPTESGPGQWVERIRRAYEQDTTPNFYQLDEWARTCHQRLMISAPVEREWRPLFRLFTACESLKVINSIANDSRKQNELAPFVDKMVEEASMALSSLAMTASPFAFDEYFHYLREQSTRFLEEETGFDDEFIDLYTILWTRLFKNRQDRLDEWNYLQDLNHSDNKRIALGIIHLAILLEKDDIAIEHINKFGTNFAPFALQYIEWMPKERLSPFLPSFISEMESFVASLDNQHEKIHFTRVLFQALDKGGSDKIDMHTLEKLYMALMPYSRYRYKDLLFDREDYKTWAALQMYMNNTIDLIDRYTLDIVAKNDPEALKPLYHASIISLIENRNRDSYKKAVRYLKKLRTLYRKQKNLAQWKRYLTALLHNTKRLRAFQEECRKGKLIHEE